MLVLFAPSIALATGDQSFDTAKAACDTRCAANPNFASCSCKEVDPPTSHGPTTGSFSYDYVLKSGGGTTHVADSGDTWNASCTVNESAANQAFAGAAMNEGQQSCYKGCLSTYSCGSGYQGTGMCSVSNGAGTERSYGTLTKVGTLCGGQPATPPAADKKSCDPNTGICYTPDGDQYCANNGAGPCVPRQGNGNGACASGTTDTLCTGKEGPAGSTPPATPAPPDPPIPTGQTPNVSTTTNNTTINNNTTTNNTTKSDDYKNPPAQTAPGKCPDGSNVPASGTCSNGQAPTCPGGAKPSPEGKCNGGTTTDPPTHPGTCSTGTLDPATGKCSNGALPSCPGGSGGSPDIHGQCAGANPTTGGPNSCGGTGTLNGTTCYCPPGTTYTGSVCTGTGTNGNGGNGNGPPNTGNGDPTKTGAGVCDGPSPPPSCKDTASGGGDCGAPPQCSGDEVSCNQLYQTWALRCQNGKVSTDLLVDLYTKSTDTTTSEIDTYKEQIASSPLIAAGAHFFTLNASGSCPRFTIPDVAEWANLDGGFLCNGLLDQILLLVGYVVLAAAAYEAFRIALY